MSLSYPKISEEQDLMRGLLDKGDYPFQVLKIEKKRTSTNRYDMLVVELMIQLDNRSVVVKDWIVLMEEMAWKFRHFASTCGLLDKYENDTLDVPDFKNKTGIVKIGTRTYQDKQGEDRLANSVQDYVKSVTPKVVIPQDDFESDAIPF